MCRCVCVCEGETEDLARHTCSNDHEELKE